MPVRVDAVIYVPGKEPGTDRRQELSIDPFPVEGGGVQINAGQYGSVVDPADLREALDRADRLRKEDEEA